MSLLQACGGSGENATVPAVLPSLKVQGRTGTLEREEEAELLRAMGLIRMSLPLLYIR